MIKNPRAERAGRRKANVLFLHAAQWDAAGRSTPPPPEVPRRESLRALTHRGPLQLSSTGDVAVRDPLLSLSPPVRAREGSLFAPPPV